MTDIQAPYITEMERKGYCYEYDDFYGINRNKTDGDDEYYGPDTSDER